MKYSIIIPTYNHLDDCLRPCIESICNNTILDDVEIVVVSNGSTDGTNEYLYEQQKYIKNLRIVTTDEPLGYPLAINMGLQISRGQFIVLLNNDTEILDFCAKNEWLEMLYAPFIYDDTMGITGPSKLYCKEANSHFLVFFCVMLRRKMLDQIGILDLIFGKGSSDDIDLCLRAEQNGWKVKKIPDDNTDWSYTTKFPIYHKGEVTVHEIDDWEEGVYEKNLRIIKVRTDRSYYSNFADVTCEISTKGRYKTTLPLAIMSIAQQELKPKKVLIFQDDFSAASDAPKKMQKKENDMTAQEVYVHLLTMLTNAGIDWSVIYGEGKGQVTNHQKALEMAETEWIWRLDDDNYAESDVLRSLMNSTGDGIVAVAPSVIDPLNSLANQNWSTKMVHINTHSNVQWLKGKGTIPAEHLYSTFIYRKDAGLKHGYDANLSPVGHREESIFTYNMFKDGGKLLVNRDVVTWHLRMKTGGIRSHSDQNLWAKDEAYFRLLCEQWAIKPMERFWINMDGGRGDHYMLRMALPDIRAKHPDKLITVAAAFPECLEGEADLDVTSVAEGMHANNDFSKLNVYQWCMKNNWKESLVEAFKQIYI